jgi:RNAse (barnase) inhibitor barstar
MKSFLGHKQCPSLSQAMQKSSLINKHLNYSHSQQYHSSCSQKLKFEEKKNIDFIERNICEKIENNLNKHYKQIKFELNKVRNRIDTTDLFLDRIENVIDSALNCLIENDLSLTESLNEPQTRTMKWRKQSKSIKSTSNIIKQTNISNNLIHDNSKSFIKPSFIMYE